MFLGFLNPLRFVHALRLRAAKRRHAKNPGPKETLLLAQLLVGAGDRAGALNCLRRARQSFPRNQDIKRLHDMLWRQAAEAEVRSIERKLRFGGGCVEDTVRLIELHRSMKNFDRCLAVARDAERRFPKSWLLKLAVGKTLYHRFLGERSKEDGKKAVECLRQSLMLKPGSERALLYLTALLAELGHTSEAAAAAEELYQVAPGNERARRLRARLCGTMPAPGAPAAGRRGPARSRMGVDADLLSGLLERLKGCKGVLGAFVFDPEGKVLQRHAVENDHFALEERDGSIFTLARAAQAAADRIGIGRLQTCIIEGNPWWIYFGEVTGGMLAVLSDRSFDGASFENLVSRFSMDLVNK